MVKLTANQSLIWNALSIDWKPGLQVMDAANLPSTSFYPAIRSLEYDGLVESQWGEATENRGGFRPRLYRRVSGGDRPFVEVKSQRAKGAPITVAVCYYSGKFYFWRVKL